MSSVSRLYNTYNKLSNERKKFLTKTLELLSTGYYFLKNLL